MKLRSMRIRTTLACVLVFAPFLFAVSHVVVFTHRRARAEQTRETARMLVGKMQRFYHHHGWDKAFTELFSAPEVKNLRIGGLVANANGEAVWRSPNDAPKWPRPTPDPATIVEFGDLTLYLVKPEDFGLDPGELHTLFTLSAAVLVAFTVGAWLVVGWTLSPIRSLARQASSASADGPRTRLACPSRDAEIIELVGTLNGFLSRMEAAVEEKSHFYAAASHELRTPLQALLGHLEVTLGQPRSAEEYQATVQEAHTQARRLVSLVEGVLLLHQLQGVAVTESESLCISAVVKQNLEMLGPLLEARSLRVTTELESGITAVSIPTHASVLVRNLLENAAKYGREGGLLSITLDRKHGLPRLRIENEVADGATIPVDRLFEPFYREDASRSAKSGGNGLGLAICRAVAKANGWKLSLMQENSFVVAEVEFHC
jgi:signal transduction histidine kinase